MSELSEEQVEARFWAKVDRSGTCWLWTGAHTTKGYGSFYLYGRSVKAHRYAYESRFGAVPEGLVLDHLCRTRDCVNPDHLEPVTDAENIRRGVAAERSRNADTCRAGLHPWPDSMRRHGPRRVCIECKRLSWTRSRQRRREQAA